MKPFVNATLVVLATLLAAALVALGEPANAEVRIAQCAPYYDTAVVNLLGLD